MAGRHNHQIVADSVHTIRGATLNDVEMTVSGIPFVNMATGRRPSSPESASPDRPQIPAGGRSVKTTWMNKFHKAIEAKPNDDGAGLIFNPDDSGFHIEFEDHIPQAQPAPVLAWTEGFVYFPVRVPSQEPFSMAMVHRMGWAPRNPMGFGQTAEAHR